MNFKPLGVEEEMIAKKIVEAAFRVHHALGPGLLEHIYESCFCYELSAQKLRFERQIYKPIIYKSLRFESALRLDVVVEDKIICELKAVEVMIPAFQAQLLSYLKMTGLRLGLLINFNVPVIKNGIKRIIL